MLRPWGASVLPFEIKKASLALRIESRLEKIFSMGLHVISSVIGRDYLIVAEEGWFGQPKYSTPLKFYLRCIGLCF